MSALAVIFGREAAALLDADKVFAILYAKHQRLVRMVASKYATAETIDDCEQQAWISILESLRAGRRPAQGHASGWIATITRQTAIASRKQRNTRNDREVSPSSLASESESQDEAMDRVSCPVDGYATGGYRVLSSPMSDAIQGLGKRARQILEMRFVTGLDGAEVAQMLGLSRASIDVSISRSLKILRGSVKK